ncbi:hypothetical protein [Acidiphilium acidophilum]|uniref:hypothetical protein n=1 Tax=Acidiphilium acidophilum TaxID=76588 RepID=UPI002E8E6D1C|nr:hypothetical protein [Acidiphilium acidophilum]
MKTSPSQGLDVRHFALAIHCLTLAILAYIVLAAPRIDLLHAKRRPDPNSNPCVVARVVQ